MVALDKMKISFFILAVLSFLSFTAARPRDYVRHVAKRVLVTDVTVIEVPEVIIWVDNTGSTVTVETKGHIITHKPAQHMLDKNTATTTLSHDTPTTTIVPPTVTDLPPPISKLVPEPKPTTEVKPTEVKPTEVKPTEIKPTEIKPTKVKPTEVKPTEAKPTEAKPIEAKPTEIKPTEVKPTYEPKPTTSKTPVSVLPITSETTHELPAPTTLPSPPNGPAEKWFSGNGFGICYAPYNADGKCKSQDQVYADFAKLHDYGIVRSYGVDCDQIETMINAAKRYNKKVLLGLFTIQDVGPELNTFIAAAKDNWSHIYAVAIGNEVVNTGKASAHDLTNAVKFAREILRSKGYTGPVVAVDTVNAMIAHPEICEASDFCAVNIHPFFDPHTSAAEAGEFVRDQAKAVSNAVHGSKRVIVTETGWPHGGNHNGEAIPTRENQHTAMESLMQAYKGTNGELFLFSAFDDPWKQDGSNTFGAEKFWGIQ
ncbi:uncharacterized protein GIQ15_00079 [Arthroderma uncinatum]|uniref:uncharacterized protein n=1 Tax=Arthroderma uncinatum TaxID=74035 RepID=UPI00144AF4FA|nr:uncharacterized protein GIQ15_00079 [Arthroderma uncinatum]KAF3490562.1 hypothetical protein GIQ15_00079 [Arthroderma uncinatum]